MNPLKPVSLEGQGAKDRRAERHGVNGRAKIVAEAGQVQFHGANRTACSLLRLMDRHGVARFCHRDGRDQAVRAGADDMDGVLVCGHGLRMDL